MCHFCRSRKHFGFGAQIVPAECVGLLISRHIVSDLLYIMVTILRLKVEDVGFIRLKKPRFYEGKYKLQSFFLKCNYPSIVYILLSLLI